MNNEPVAWMTTIYRDDHLLGRVKIPQFHQTKPPSHFYDEIIPLYTHPTKTLDLTNEEIRKVLLSNTRMSMCVWLSSGITKEEIEWFARAILQRASEK